LCQNAPRFKASPFDKKGVYNVQIVFADDHDTLHPSLQPGGSRPAGSGPTSDSVMATRPRPGHRRSDAWRVIIKTDDMRQHCRAGPTWSPSQPEQLRPDSDSRRGIMMAQWSHGHPQPGAEPPSPSQPRPEPGYSVTWRPAESEPGVWATNLNLNPTRTVPQSLRHWQLVSLAVTCAWRPAPQP
jgi:hypothetical protein